jgi:hypothetical protein
MLVTLSDFHQASIPFESFEVFLQEAFAWYNGESEDTIYDNYYFRFSAQDTTRFCALLAEYC